MALAGAIPKSGSLGLAIAGRGAWSPAIVVASTRRHLQIGASQDAQKSVAEAAGETKTTGDEPRGIASASDASGEVDDTEQDLGEMAKDAWSSAKATAHKVKEVVTGEAKETIQDTAETVKRAMNSKDC